MIADKAKFLIEQTDTAYFGPQLDGIKTPMPDYSEVSTPANREQKQTPSPSFRAAEQRLSSAASNISKAKGKSLTKLGRKMAATLLDKLDLKDKDLIEFQHDEHVKAY